ncbi:hypothetical protein TNCV_4389121 [Trichonephila clavipes]|nr:hypothetical protein TNCV_4389121 [Trichonephila clavipes]
MAEEMRNRFDSSHKARLGKRSQLRTRQSDVLQCEKKGGNRLVSGPDYMVDALKLPNQAPRGYGELLQKSVFWRCPDGTQHLFCWPFLVNR